MRNPKEITLYDIYRAVDCGKGELFHFHENPNPKCLVGENIHAVLDQKLNRAQRNKRGLPRSFLSPQPTERTCFSNNKRGLPRSSLPPQPIGRRCFLNHKRGLM